MKPAADAAAAISGAIGANFGVLTKTGPGVLVLSGTNAYAGGTVVNGGAAFTGTMNLSGAAGAVVVPAGGLTINNATVTEVTNGGQINAANVVTLNGGGSTLNLVNANTLAGLVFNNNGGSGSAPTVLRFAA